MRKTLEEYRSQCVSKMLGRLATQSLRRRRCHKEPHKSMGKAEAQLRSLLQRGLANPGEMESYYCSGCQAWHVGHRIGLNSR